LVILVFNAKHAKIATPALPLRYATGTLRNGGRCQGENLLNLAFLALLAVQIGILRLETLLSDKVLDGMTPML
jgi:hypothetical protein